MPSPINRDPSRRLPVRKEFVHPHRTDPNALAKLLNEWMLGDEAEQRDTFEVFSAFSG
jgi:hypothetical protein